MDCFDAQPYTRPAEPALATYAYLSAARAEEGIVDRNILAKCLHRARTRNVRLSDAARVTADSPVPYQLADLTDALCGEAGAPCATRPPMEAW